MFGHKDMLRVLAQGKWIVSRSHHWNCDSQITTNGHLWGLLFTGLVLFRDCSNILMQSFRLRSEFTQDDVKLITERELNVGNAIANQFLLIAAKCDAFFCV